jgi:glycosyltransferase involved in cell wall biosynthesis
MRYAWDQFEAYFGAAQVGRLGHWMLQPIMAALARWDRATSGRVDRYVANSHYVAGRIRRYYNRGSTVVYPPVDTGFYRLPADRRQPRAGFLAVSALVPYKRLDIAIDACRRADVPLSIVGTGPERGKLGASAGGGVTFLGWRSNEEIRELYQRSAGVLLPGIEDFGMVPVEAQACGCPVVALRQGGASETVLHEETGLLVEELSGASFADAISRARALPWNPDRLRTHAESFSRERFLTEFQAVVDEATASGARFTRAAQPAQAETENHAPERTRAEQQADAEDQQ